MKYQKSMMKIMENLLFSRGESKSIAQTIRDTHSGRSSSFDALKWLQDNGFVEIRYLGRQKIVSLVLDNHALQYKYYIDSLRFKILSSFTKLVSGTFVELLKEQEVQAVVLFGSSIKSESYNDIDILLLSKEELMNREKILRLKEKFERFFEVLINLHFGKLSIDNIFKGIVIYQSSYLPLSTNLQKQYLEFLEWCFVVLDDKKKNTSSDAFRNALVNLSYCYSYLNEYYPEIKAEALEFFNKEHTVKTFKDLQKRGVEIGKGIFK
jgi:predicted nucleotidyltransferase